jgi:MFS family permease
LTSASKKAKQATYTAKVSVRQVMAVPQFKAAIFVASAVTAVVDVLLIFLPLLGREVGLSTTEIGALLAIRAFSSMAVRVILQPLTKALGMKNLLIGGSLVTMISCLALVLFQDFWGIAIIMLISGFAMGIGQPATMAWVSRISSPATKGLAISIRLTANRFGQVTMPAVAGLVAGAGIGGVFVMLAVLQAASIGVTFSALKKSEPEGD